VSNPVDPRSVVQEEGVQERVARLRRLDACAVSDAFDRLKLSGVVAGVPRQSGAGRIAGVAVTVKLEAASAPAAPPLGARPASAVSDGRPRPRDRG
jgi:hypothetical protein